MNMAKKVTIEQLKEGFLCTDEENERYAVLNLSAWLKDFFQLPEEQPQPEKKKIKMKASGESIKNDDWMFKPYGLSRATRVDKDQEYTKIEGDM